MFQKVPSVSSVAGIVTFTVGVGLIVFALSQFDYTRRMMGIPTKGTLGTSAS